MSLPVPSNVVQLLRFPLKTSHVLICSESHDLRNQQVTQVDVEAELRSALMAEKTRNQQDRKRPKRPVKVSVWTPFEAHFSHIYEYL